MMGDGGHQQVGVQSKTKKEKRKLVGVGGSEWERESIYKMGENECNKKGHEN